MGTDTTVSVDVDDAGVAVLTLDGPERLNAFSGTTARALSEAYRRCDSDDAVRAVVERIGENCEPSLTTVLFLGGAGGSLRAGATENPVLLTRAIKNALVNVTCGGAPAYVWPGGGITVMVDVMRMPERSFGTVPTPAIVAPIEFSMRRDDYAALGGHLRHVRSLEDVLRTGAWHNDGAPTRRAWAAGNPANPWPLGHPPQLG